MRYWLIPRYRGGGKGPTLRGKMWQLLDRLPVGPHGGGCLLVGLVLLFVAFVTFALMIC